MRPIITTKSQSSTPFKVQTTINAAVLIVPIIAFFLIRQVSDSDMWFHMAVGKQILATGALPATDKLSLLNSGQPVNAYLWLFQILAAAGYPFAGFWWLQSLQVAILGLAFFFVFRSTRVWTSSMAAWLLLLAAVIASSERFSLRPEIVSILMIALYYFRLQQGKYHSPADLAKFFILQTIWTNSHGIFVIGPALTGCYLVEALIKGLTGKGYKEAKSSGILTGITAAACFVTPYGPGNIKYAWRLFVESNPLASEISNSTYEMGAALGRVSRTLLPFWFYFFLIITFFTGLLAVILYRRQQLSIARTLIGFSLLAASLTGMKNMPVFAIVAAPMIAEHFSLLDRIRIRLICGAIILAVMAAAATVWSPRPAFQYLKTWVPYRFGLGLSADYVPIKLPEFLDGIGFSGPIFNSMEQGGFYEYHGYPARIPFYDSRLQDYDPQGVIASYEAVVNASRHPAGWHDLERRFAFRGILLGNLPDDREAAGLLPLIASDPAWRLVYLDYAASFWMRADKPDSPPAVDANRITGLIESVSNASQAENVNFFLEQTGRHPELRRKLLENAAGQWNNTSLLIDLGLLEMQSGNQARAEQIFLNVLRMKPDSRVTLATLAQIALMRNDRNGAEKYIRKALRHYPDDADLRQNLDTILNYR
jgi:hypothetical protein